MNKALEYLEELKFMIEYFTRLDYVEPIVRNEIHDKFKDIYWNKLPHLDTIEENLKRLEEIENLNSNEALKCLSLLGDFEWHKESFKEEFPDLFDTIKQVLLKAQEQEKENESLKLRVQALEKDLDDQRELAKYYLEEQEKENAELKIKSQKEHNALMIIKEKRVDLPYLRCCIEDNQSVYRYNEYIRNKTIDYDHEQELTEEEFSTVKEVLE